MPYRTPKSNPDEQRVFVVPAEPTNQPPERQRRSLIPLLAVAAGALAVGVVVGAGFGANGFELADEAQVPPTDLAEPLPPESESPPEATSQGLDPLPTVLGEVNFAVQEVPYDRRLDEIVSTPFGAIGVDTAVVYWSEDYQDWNVLPVEGVQAPVGIAVAGNGVVVHGTNAVRYRWVGDDWIGTEWVEDIALGLRGNVDRMVFGPRGALAMSEVTIQGPADGIALGPQTMMSYAPDGVHFSESGRAPRHSDLEPFRAPGANETFAGGCDPKSDTRRNGQPSIGPVLATESGFVAVTPRHPDDWPAVEAVCSPIVWYSEDGNEWSVVSTLSPFGPDAYVYSIAEHDGRFVAVGGDGSVGDGTDRTAVWVSEDGINWDRIGLHYSGTPAIGGGEAGWVLADDQHVWFSHDGRRWDGPFPLPATDRSPLASTDVVVGPDTIVLRNNRWVAVAQLETLS